MPQSAPTLSVAQVLVLRTAASRPDRMVLPLPTGLRVRGATQRRLLAGLLRAGLAEEVPVDDDALCWRKDADGQRFGLRVTPLGMAAVEGDGSCAGGVVDERPAPTLQRVAGSGPTDDRSAADRDAVHLAGAIRGDAPDTDPAPATTHGDPEVGTDHSSAATHHMPAPAAPRPRGKLGRVLDALSTADGATLVEIIDLTGWQPHTARAALTGLRKRGFAVGLTTDEAGRKAYHARQGRPA
jgi:hypothetical protein